MDFEAWMGLSESYMDAYLLQGADDASMMGVFKISLRTEGYKILRSRPKQCETLDEMIQSMKEYYNSDHVIGRSKCYLKCAFQKSDESVVEFGGRIREYARRAKLYELEYELTRDFFLNGLEDSEIKEKLFDEMLATFEDAERKERAVRQKVDGCVGKTCSQQDVERGRTDERVER